MADHDDGGRDASNDLNLGREMTTVFKAADGTEKTHRHSALALALASPYAGKRGSHEPNPALLVPERTAFQARAEYRELLDVLAAAAAAYGNIEYDGALADRMEAVLAKHNLPRPASS